MKQEFFSNLIARSVYNYQSLISLRSTPTAFHTK